LFIGFLVFLVMQKLLDVLTELEKLKPEVQKQVDQYNKSFVKSTSPSYSVPSSYSTPYNTSFSYNSTLQPDTGASRSSYNKNQSIAGIANRDKVCWIHYVVCVYFFKYGTLCFGGCRTLLFLVRCFASFYHASYNLM
jgi:hypothetical protein